MPAPHEPVPSGFDALSDPAAVRALAHPTRTKIFIMAVHEPVSATDAGRYLQQPVDRVSYHMRTLAEAGLIAPVRRTQRRGATETHYRAVATFDVSDDVLDASSGLRTTMYSVVVDEMAADMSTAVHEGAAEEDDFLAARGHFVVSEAGRKRLADELRAIHLRLAALEQELREEALAGGGEPAHEMNILLALYPGDLSRGRNRPWTASRAWPDYGEPPLVGVGRPVSDETAEG
jgi:DNA-binding transcriptional ArsR family regulator